MRNLITDIAGVTVGHATDVGLGSGVTAIVFDKAGGGLRHHVWRCTGRP